jgi:hypothetical protein
MNAEDPGTDVAVMTRALVQTISKGAWIMAEDWGLCMDCKWWQIEPEATIERRTLGLCIDEDLQPFRLLVSGDSGCNHFMAGEPARARGSASAPPTAQPTR